MMLYARLSDRRMHVPRGARDHACAVLVRFLYLWRLFSLFFLCFFRFCFPFFLFLRSVSVFLSCSSLFFSFPVLSGFCCHQLFLAASLLRARSRALFLALVSPHARTLLEWREILKCADPARPDPGVTSASSRRRHARGSAAKKRPTTCLRGATMATVTRGADVAGRPGHGGDRQPPTLQQGATHIPHAGGWRRY